MSTKNINTFIRGTCTEMCPRKERDVRQRERLLHPLEVLKGTENQDIPAADPKKVVKSFGRSAAGRKSLSPSDLRPLHVLEKTVSYLFEMLVFDRSKDWCSEYDFIFDRLRAVHQDAIIQCLNTKQALPLYESLARFLVYSGYRLCVEPRYKYDPVINRNYLQECLKKILCLYDDLDSDSSPNIENRSELEALYLTHNLGDPIALHRGVTLKKSLRGRDFELSLAMSLAVWHGHYIQALKIFKYLPLILSCAAAIHIPNIRRKAFQVMCHAYSSKNLLYPIEDLKSQLLYSSNDQLINDGKHYNILHQNRGFSFLKGSFNEEADQISPRPIESIDKMLISSNLPQLLLTGKES